jgi:hypothetical protein
MTISTTTIKNSYSGDGSTTVFNYTFKITDEDHVEVLTRASDGTEVTKTITTDYTVSGVGDANGGSVTFGTAPASGLTVILRRDTPQTQGMDLIENDPLPANTLEDAHDKIMSVAQELQEEVDRSIKLSRTNTMTSTEFTVGASDRANKVLAFDSLGEISVTQELGTYQGTDTTTTTAAYDVRDIIKSTTTAQLNNVYICVAASVVGDLLTDTDHFELLVDAVSAASSATAAASSATASANSATASAASAATAETHKDDAETAKTASETAKTGSETAKTAAETAQTAAETAQAAAETAKTGAETAQTAAETARDQAQAAANFEILSDTTPQLGGNLDLNSNNITGTGNIDIAGTIKADTWQSIQTSAFTAEAAKNYFVNTTSAAITATLPLSATLGDEIRFIDYAGTFDTNNLTIARNGHVIQGVNSDLVVSTERAAFGLVYVDATQGWLLTEK